MTPTPPSILAAFANYLRDALRVPGQPPPAVFAFTNERVSAMRIKVTLTPPKSANVVSRELTYTVDGGAAHVVTLNPANDPPYTFLVDDGAQIVGSLVDISKNGVRSDPSDATTFSALDMAKPGKPDAPVFEAVAEVPVAA